MEAERLILRVVADATQYLGVMNLVEGRLLGFTVAATSIIGRHAVAIAAEYEKVAVAFEAMTGNAVQARKTLQEITTMAIETPFHSDELTAAAKQLKAFGYETSEIMPTLRALGEVSAGTGTKMERIILAFGQVRVAGRLLGTELRQFVDAGVPLIEYLGKVLNLPQAMVRHAVSKGEVGYQDVVKAVNLMTQPGLAQNADMVNFFGLTDKVNKTVAGQWESLTETIEVKMRNFMTSLWHGFDLPKSLSDTIQEINKLFGDVNETTGHYDNIVNFGKEIRSLYTAFKEIISPVLNWVKANDTLLITITGIVGGALVLTAVVRGIIFVFGALSSVLTGFIPVLGLLRFALLSFVAIGMTDMSFTDIVDSFSNLRRSVDSWISQNKGLIAAFVATTIAVYTLGSVIRVLTYSFGVLQGWFLIARAGAIALTGTLVSVRIAVVGSAVAMYAFARAAGFVRVVAASWAALGMVIREVRMLIIGTRVAMMGMTAWAIAVGRITFAFRVLRTAIASVGVFSGFAAAFPALTAGLTSLVTAYGPILLVVAALTSLFLLLRENGTFNNFGDTFLQGFRNVTAQAIPVWEGLVNAIKKGDLESAFDGVFAYIKLAFLTTVVAIRAEWTRFRMQMFDFEDAAFIAKKTPAIAKLNVFAPHTQEYKDAYNEIMRLNKEHEDKVNAQSDAAVKASRDRMMNSPRIKEAQEGLTKAIAKMNIPKVEAPELSHLAAGLAFHASVGQFPEGAMSSSGPITEALKYRKQIDEFQKSVNQGRPPVNAMGQVIPPVPSSHAIIGMNQWDNLTKAQQLNFQQVFKSAETNAIVKEAVDAAIKANRLLSMKDKDPFMAPFVLTAVADANRLAEAAASASPAIREFVDSLTKGRQKMNEMFQVNPKTQKYTEDLLENYALHGEGPFAKFQIGMNRLNEALHGPNGGAGLASVTGMFAVARNMPENFGNLIDTKMFNFGLFKEFQDLEKHTGNPTDKLPGAAYAGTAQAQDIISKASMVKGPQEHILDTLLNANEIAKQSAIYQQQAVALLTAIAGAGGIEKFMKMSPSQQQQAVQQGGITNMAGMAGALGLMLVGGPNVTNLGFGPSK